MNEGARFEFERDGDRWRWVLLSGRGWRLAKGRWRATEEAAEAEREEFVEACGEAGRG